MRSKLRLLLTVCLLLVAPNAVWLFRSTVRVRNDGYVALEAMRVVVDTVSTPPRTVRSRSSRFLLLPDEGEATASVTFRVGNRSYLACQEYVEGSMYHVVFTVEPDLDVVCETNLALTSSLLLLELVR